MKKKQSIWIYLFTVPSILALLMCYIAPLIITVTTSFFKWDGADFIKFIGLDNYKNVILNDADFIPALVNTFKWAFAAAFIHVPFGVLVALILAKKIRGWKFVRSVFLIPSIIAGAAWAVIYSFMFNPEIGVINNLIRQLGFSGFDLNWFYDNRTAFLSLTLTWIFYAGYINLIVFAEIVSIPTSVIESACIEGASSIQTDIYIRLPLLRNIIGTGMIMAVTSTLKMFEVIFLTTHGGPGNITMNLPVMLYYNTVNFNYGYGNAIATILLGLGLGFIVLITKAFRMNKSSYE